MNSKNRWRKLVLHPLCPWYMGKSPRKSGWWLLAGLLPRKAVGNEQWLPLGWVGTALARTVATAPIRTDI